MSYKVFVVAGDNEALSALPSAVGAGIDVVLLQSSNEALWELQQSAPDALVADVDLPGFSGVDLADLVPNFAPETKIMLCARQPRGQVDAPSAQRVLLGEQSPAQIAAALDEVLAMAAPVRAAEPEPEPEPEPAPPPAPEPVRKSAPKPVEPAPAPARASGPPPVSPRPSAAPAPARASGPPPVSPRPAPQSGAPRASGPPPVSPRPGAAPAPARAAGPPPVSPRPAAQQPRQQPSQRPAGQPPASGSPAGGAPAAPPPEAAPAQTSAKKRSGGPLVLTAESLAPIRAKLKDLGLQLGAQATVLTDRWGVPLVEEGRTTLPLPPFLPLLATSFSTMIDYTRQLHADEGSGLYMHEGNRYDIYIFDVGRQFLLVMIFDKVVASSKLGTIWIYAKRAVRDLADDLEND